MKTYDKIVHKIATMVLSGIWYSDAYELVFKGLSDKEYKDLEKYPCDYLEEELSYHVDEKVDSTGKRVPLPKYKPIF